MQLVHATTPEHLVTIRELFQEYAIGMGMNFHFQGFAEELATLPGKYAPPRGRLLLAVNDEQAAGCVALRPLAEGVCEMKRLFVRPQFRGQGVARRMAETILAEARALDYRVMRLDTLKTMRPAMALYQSLGFEEIRPYYDNPLPDVVYFERKLW
ncbi:MAG: GNAT family N-acetyltransferase [Verrucomicrobia bacterium]|nr:GNAT family N-acetyltransferase [Verrucomicrobiota bacterium]